LSYRGMNISNVLLPAILFSSSMRDFKLYDTTQPGTSYGSKCRETPVGGEIRYRRGNLAERHGCL